MKIAGDNWNIQTTKWLRRICYDRLPRYNTLGVFILNAVWHGVHPGFQFTFISTALCVHAGRKIRQLVRPLFQTNAKTRFLYDVVTVIGTQLGIAYCFVSFTMTNLNDCLQFYK